MPLIIISRGSESHGEKVAGKLALKLGYPCLCRESLLKESVRGAGPLADLFRAAAEGRLALDRMDNGREKYLAHVRKALLDSLGKDNAVYHGFAAHTFVQGVSHVVKVRINPDREQRLAGDRGGLKGPGAEQPLKRLRRRQASQLNGYSYLHGIDLADPGQYDLVISMRTMTVDEAVEVIARTAQRACFQPTEKSGDKLQMLCLAARVQLLLAEESPFVKVEVEDGDITVSTEGYWKEAMKVMNRVEQIVGQDRYVGIKVILKTPRN
ncbi:MAG: cytidylate kinase family protein [Syntrophobacteraceae bacterium]|nr:cytidylate kinase family protein [Syntrophobacteraceae bacterium]